MRAPSLRRQRTLLTATLLTTLACAALAPAGAHGAATSPGVRPLSTLPERGLVSAKAVGRLLYTSSVSGVSIYDIADPRRPRRIGRLELPNVQNEDVDVGNGILLVSDDPVGGRGILHVIDVRDPTAPRLLSTYSTWVPGLLTEPFGNPRRKRGGIGHTASCIQDCRFAWLAGSGDGIEVVDLRNPARPRLAGRFRARAAAGISTHDVQVDQRGNAWVAGGNGTAAYDTRRPVKPRLITRTDRRGGRGPLNDYIHHNSQRVGRDTLLITEEDLRGGCRRAGSFQTWRVRGRRARPLDSFSVERDRRAREACSAHYFDHRDGLVAAGFYQQGLRILDVSRPRRIRQVGFHVPDSPMAWGALFAPTDPAGEVVYVLDHAVGIRVVELDREALAPVRRKPPRRGRGSGGRFNVFSEIYDGFGRVRPGQRLRIEVAAASTGRSAGDVPVEVMLGRQLRDVRPPRGATYDPATRTVRFRLGRVPGARVGGSGRVIRARVARGARRGSILEVISYARATGDLLPLDDRSVDRARVGRRSTRSGFARVSAARAGGKLRASPRLFCTL